MPYYLQSSTSSTGHVVMDNMAQGIGGGATRISWDMEFECKRTGSDFIPCGRVSDSDMLVFLKSDDSFELRVRNQTFTVNNATLGGIDLNEFHVYKLEHREVNTTYETTLFVDGTEITTFTLDGPDQYDSIYNYLFPLGGGTRHGAIKYWKYTDNITAANSRYYDCDASGGTGTVVPETTGNGTDATQAGTWPGDDSEWVNFTPPISSYPYYRDFRAAATTDQWVDPDWTDYSGYWAIGTDKPSGNSMKAWGATWSNSGYSAAAHTDSAKIGATLAMTGSESEINFALSLYGDVGGDLSGTSQTCYSLRVFGDSLFFHRIVAGTLGSQLAVYSYTPVDEDDVVFEVLVNGGEVDLIGYVNGVEVTRYTDTSPLANGGIASATMRGYTNYLMIYDIGIDGVTAEPSISITGDLTPGGAFTIDYSDFTAIPVSPATLTDSQGNAITVAVTINDTDTGGVHSGTADGTMPALPGSGSATGLLFGTVTVELTT